LEAGKRFKIWYLGGVLLLAGAVIIGIRQSRKKKKPVQEVKPVSTPRESMQKTRENSIILFGGFQVIDKEGKDITAQFTPLPRKLLLFILLHSLKNNKGVSSNTMYETFWFDKSVESARNNRAVNIVKLKSLLENVDSASISKETGYWKFDFDPSLLYVDYMEYLQIVRSSKEPSREDIVDLLDVVENKPFLNNTNADWLDPFKSDVSNEIIDTFLNYIGKSEDDPEFLLHLTKCIFLSDAVSEEALRVQCRLLIKQGKHSLAKQAYSSFIHEYKQLYDEDYSLSFNQVIDET
jgi:DNA-binding SARP family transcriptional activator